MSLEVTLFSAFRGKQGEKILNQEKQIFKNVFKKK
jgi:hypothetical protein